MSDTEWRRHAACWDSGEIFFETAASSVLYAKSICRICPSLAPCREDALAPRSQGDADQYGVQAGMTPAERTAYRRNEARRIARQAKKAS